MKKEYFCISDIHSGFTPMKQALWKAGYRKTNKNHVLIVCGDLFDRLDESVEVYNFIRSIPRSRRILIRGNHEDLLIDLLEKEYPEGHDFSNGTVKTVCAFTGYDEFDIKYGQWAAVGEDGSYGRQLWSMAVEDFKKMPIYEFIRNKKYWNNYYELDEYIFVHSFIPVAIKEEYSEFKDWPHYNLSPAVFCEMPNWRTQATEYDWGEARWGNPWKQFKLGLFNTELQNGKILVCGHWHTSDFYNHIDHNDSITIEQCPIYNNHGLIGLDACTAYTKRCNVLKIEKE